MTTEACLFGDMSEPRHAYALGLVAAAGGEGELAIGHCRVRMQPRLESLASHWLGALPTETDRLVFPALRRELRWAFVRGMWDAAGSISSPDREDLRARLRRPGRRLLDGLLEFLPLPPDRTGKRNLHWFGHNALDLLGHLYEECTVDPAGSPARPQHLARYLAWAHRVPPFAHHPKPPGPIRWTPVHPEAKAPFKQRITDSGYDLTLLYEKKRWGSTVLYGTGLVVEPPFGWYLDVVPRSSIIKTGYLLANSVGVIDRGYRGEILVPLVKLDPTVPELELPARVVQMIPRPIVHLRVEQAERSSASHRGGGGFGSTG